MWNIWVEGEKEKKFQGLKKQSCYYWLKKEATGGETAIRCQCNLAFIKQVSQVLQVAVRRECHQDIPVHKTGKDSPNQMASNFFLNSQRMLVERRRASAELCAALEEFWSPVKCWDAQTSSRKHRRETPSGSGCLGPVELLRGLREKATVKACCEGSWGRITGHINLSEV